MILIILFIRFLDMFRGWFCPHSYCMTISTIAFHFTDGSTAHVGNLDVRSGASHSFAVGKRRDNGCWKELSKLSQPLTRRNFSWREATSFGIFECLAVTGFAFSVLFGYWMVFEWLQRGKIWTEISIVVSGGAALYVMLSQNARLDWGTLFLAFAGYCQSMTSLMEGEEASAGLRRKHNETLVEMQE